MTLSYVNLPEAQAELIEAAVWYESQQMGLGSDFLAAAESALARIMVRPYLSPLVPDWNQEPELRSQSFEVFPYRSSLACLIIGLQSLRTCIVAACPGTGKADCEDKTLTPLKGPRQAMGIMQR